MLTVFLSGGMTGLTREEMTEWREWVKIHAKFYPMRIISMPDYFIDGAEWYNEDKEGFVFDTNWVKKSDVIIACLNSPQSVGTAQEVMLAYEYCKPIIMIANKDKWENEINPWLKHEATTVFFFEDYDNEDDLYGDVVDYAAMYG